MSDVDWNGAQNSHPAPPTGPPEMESPAWPHDTQTQHSPTSETPTDPNPFAPPPAPITSPSAPTAPSAAPAYTPPPPQPPATPPTFPPVGGMPVPPPPLPPSTPVSPPRRRGRRSGLTAVMAIVIALALALGGFALARSTEDDNPAAAKSPIGSASTVPVIDPATSNEPIAAVAAAVSPTVVQIQTNEGLGSGFVYDPQGYILTAAHVVDGAGNSVKVRLADGSTVDGEVIGTDDGTDVAVVKIEPSQGTKVATLATGVKVAVGQTAVALGSPFGLTETVTSGIVSAVDRPETTPSGAVNMIQIDTPINPGNSGGPVADLKGRIICIADQILSQSGENNGIGFCVPIDTAKAVADKMVAGQPVEFAFLGVSTDATSTSGASDGAIIVDVTSGSAADKAGLKQGDTVTAVDGQHVTDPVELGAAIRSHQPGQTVTLTVERGGKEQSVQVTLGSTKSK